MRLSVSMFACPHHDFLHWKSVLTKKYIDSIHIDMMDGICVPLKGLTEQDVDVIYSLTNLPIVFHIMARDQKSLLHYIWNLPKREGTMVILTVEDFEKKSVIFLLEESKRHGLQVGVAIWPSTPTTDLLHFLQYIDAVLVMTTEPGQLNSVFIPASFDRVSAVKFLVGDGVDVLVDGSMNYERIRKMESLGVSECVVGRSYFNNYERIQQKTFRMDD